MNMEDNKGWTDSQRKLAIQELIERDELIPPFKAYYLDDLKNFAIVEMANYQYTVNMKFGNVLSWSCSDPVLEFTPNMMDFWLAGTFFTRIVLTEKGREYAKKLIKEERDKKVKLVSD